MATAADDLDFNPFYLALQNLFPGPYQIAQDKCYLICIPHTSSLQDVEFDKDFVESHLLRPSPYFQGQYVTTDQGFTKTVHLEGAVLKTGDGFEQVKTVKILAEELGYNKDFKPFKIFVLDQPINSQYTRKKGKELSRASSVDPLANRITYTENKKFLYSFPEHEKVLSNLESKLKQFNENYMVLKGYLDDAAKKIDAICLQTSEELVDVNRHPLKSDKRLTENIKVAVQSVVAESTHSKLFPVLCEECKKQDADLVTKIQKLNELSGEKLGLRKEFCCPLTAAVVELAHVDELHTPLEKLNCLRSTLDVATESVNAHILESQQSAEADLCLTSDELIPLLVSIIIQSKNLHLMSNIFYLEHFYEPMSSADDLSFSLVTFKAAVTYFLETEFDFKTEEEERQENQLTQDGWTSKSINPSTEETSEKGPYQSKSRFERQMERMTKMMETSTMGLASSGAQLTPTTSIFSTSKSSTYLSPGVIPLKNSTTKGNDLGDFLSSLKDDVMHTSYGKQT